MAHKIKGQVEHVIKLKGVGEKDSSFSSQFILGVTLKLCMAFGIEDVGFMWSSSTKSDKIN